MGLRQAISVVKWTKSLFLQTIFLMAVFSEAIFTIIAQSLIYKFLLSNSSVVLQEGTSRGYPVYLMLFIFCKVFECYLSLDSLLSKNLMQLFGFIIFHMCSIAYAGIQFIQLNRAFQEIFSSIQSLPQPLYYDYSDLITSANTQYTMCHTLLIVLVSIMGAFQFLYFYFGYRMLYELRWDVYKRLGADLTRKIMYRSYLLFHLAFKLMLFFHFCFAAQYLMLVQDTTDWEKALAVLYLLMLVIVIPVGLYAVRHEKKWIMWLFFVALLLAIGFVTVRVVRIYTAPDRLQAYANVGVLLTVFGGLSIAVTAWTLRWAIQCFMNFDKGMTAVLLQGKSAKETGVERAFSLDDDYEEDEAESYVVARES